MKILILILVSTLLLAKLPYNMVAYNKAKNIKVDIKEVCKISRDLNVLTYEQIEVLSTVYKACKPYGLSNTCMAISYKESKLGKYLFDTVTGDYGIMGINLKAFLDSENTKLNYWGKRALASKLIINNDLNLAISIKNLQYWVKVNKSKNWGVIWGSYNGGWTPNYAYSSDIINIIKAFDIYFKNHPDVSSIIKGHK